MLNKVIMIGRLIKSPELKKTNNGIYVTHFSLAVNRGYNSYDGQTADYINCVAWNKIAENIKKYCSKGSQMAVEGRFRSYNYENKQGTKVYAIEVICESIEFLSNKKSKNENNVHEDNIHDEKNNSSKIYDMKNEDLRNDFDPVDFTDDILNMDKNIRK